MVLLPKILPNILLWVSSVQDWAGRWPVLIRQLGKWDFSCFFIKKKKVTSFIYLFIYLWLCWVFTAAQSLLRFWWVGAISGCGTQTSHCSGVLLLQGTGCRSHRLQELWRVGSLVAAPGLWGTGSIVVAHGLSWHWHVGPSWFRDRTCVSCVSRWILYHWWWKLLPLFLDKMYFSQPLCLTIGECMVKAGE